VLVQAERYGDAIIVDEIEISLGVKGQLDEPRGGGWKAVEGGGRIDRLYEKIRRSMFFHFGKDQNTYTANVFILLHLLLVPTGYKQCIA